MMPLRTVRIRPRCRRPAGRSGRVPRTGVNSGVRPRRLTDAQNFGEHARAEARVVRHPEVAESFESL